MKKGKFAIGVVLAAVLALGAQTAFGIVTTDRGTTFLEVVKARGTDATDFTKSDKWVSLPGAVVTVTVPANEKQLLNASFTAESACTGPTGLPAWCSVRLVINGITEMEPAVGTDFAFDSTNQGAETFASWEGHAMERSRTVTGGCPGLTTFEVRAQARVTDPGVNLRLDDWHLAVERIFQANLGPC